jgi:alpha-D-ribose 1-methylphosphonate 5-triphosphate diphosphatase
MQTYLTNARLVLPDTLLSRASLLIDDGLIAAIDPIDPPADRTIDLKGALLLPGLIDLHCDAIEKEVEPRPGVCFPLPLAVAAVDRRNAVCGITTVFHAIAFAEGELGVRNSAVAAALVNEIWRQRKHTLVDNRVHARYELSDADSAAVLATLLAENRLHALSLMDHTPGQGQFATAEAYQQYLMRSYRADESAAATLIERKRAGASAGLSRAAALARQARAAAVPLLSHDDDSPARIATMSALGITLSEFPLNLATAQAASERGLTTIVGAPNLIRGGSQSGGMHALDAVQAGVADCLCSDYAPSSLLPAVLQLPQLAAIDLPAAVCLATRNPARAIGLHDRGELRPGLRADLIAINNTSDQPHLIGLWSAGQPHILDQRALQ